MPPAAADPVSNEANAPEKEKEKGSVLDIVYSPPSFLRRYKRWFR
jgi:hypothetical protein